MADDLDTIKFNVSKMIANGAPEADIESYLTLNKVTAQQLRDSGKPAGPRVSRSEGMAQGFGQGVTMGFGDELTAGVRAAAPGLSNWMMSGPDLQRDESIGGSPTPQTVSTAGTYDERYAEELAKEKAKDASFAKSNPYLSTGSKVAGGVANAIATAPLIPPWFRMNSGSFVGNSLRGLGQGAVYGGITGYGEGEGDVLDWEKRLPNTAKGAAIGGGAGLATPLIGAAATRAAEIPPARWLIDNAVMPVVRAVTPKAEPLMSTKAAGAAFTPRPGPTLLAQQQGTGGAGGPVGPSGPGGGSMAEWSAIDRLATAVQRSGRDASELIARANQLGPKAVLADLDPQITAIAEGLNILPGRTKTFAPKVLDARSDEAGPRMKTALRGSEPPPSRFELTGEGQAFDQNLKVKGAAAYDTMRQNKLNISAEMQNLMRTTPSIREALETVEKNAAHEGITLSPIDIADRVKQHLNKSADAAFNKGTVINKADVGSTADKWEAAFWKANPSAKEAASVYRQAASLPEFFDIGSNFLLKGTSETAAESSLPGIQYALRNADPQQRLATRTGLAVTGIEQAATPEGARKIARGITRSSSDPVEDGVKAKIRELYRDNPAHAEEIIRAAEAEGVFEATRHSITGGSPTGRRLVNALEQGAADIPPVGTNAPGALQWLQIGRNWLNNPNEGTRDALGQVVLTMNPAENRRILEEVARRLAARQSGNALRTTVTGGAAQAAE